MKGSIVFVDSSFVGYFEPLVEGLKKEYSIVDVFAVDDIGKTELAGYELRSLKDILTIGNIDIAIILCKQIDNIKQLVNVAFQGKEIKKFSFKEVIDELLDDKGKMLFFKQYIDNRFVRLSSPHEVGDFTYYSNLYVFNEDTESAKKVVIGKFSSIGHDNQFLLGEEHHIEWMTSYPLEFLFGEMVGERKVTSFSKGDIIIGNDVWTGNDVKFLSGVNVGDGCVIGAGTVVTKSVEPYSVVCGNPGKVVKKRFSEEKIEKLLEMKWWDWDYAVIYKVRDLLQSEDIDSLYDYYLKVKSL